MELSLPDPITNFNRETVRRRYQRREEYILGNRPGFNLIYWQRIIRAPARVARWGRHFGWPPEQVLLTQALLISRMACVFIDHIIRRMEQADLLEARPGAPHAEWENQYRHFLLLFLRQRDIPARRQIVKQMQLLHHYTLPPASLIDFRRRHWARIEHCIPPLLRNGGSLSLFTHRQFTPGGRPAAAARHICFTAAVYSDIQERRYRQQWMYAYSDCMLRLYDQLRKQPAILAALLRLP